MEILTKGCRIEIQSRIEGEEVSNTAAIAALQSAQKQITLQSHKRPWDHDEPILDKAALKLKQTGKSISTKWSKLSFTEKCMAVTTGTIVLKVATAAFREIRLAWRFK